MYWMMHLPVARHHGTTGPNTIHLAKMSVSFLKRERASTEFAGVHGPQSTVMGVNSFYFTSGLLFLINGDKSPSSDAKNRMMWIVLPVTTQCR